MGEVSKTRTLKGPEEARVTSPNGEFDAVLIRDDGGGAAGGWEWYVYIVAKGEGVDESKDDAVLNAGTFKGEQLVWDQEHLLEVRYDIAYISQFRNIWGSYEIHDAKGTSGSRYLVEIRLAPAHPDFSLLTPDGQFHPRQ
jgi:hypothetical protein